VIEILRDSLYKGEAYYNRTQPGDVRRPYGLRGLKDRHPGNGQGSLGVEHRAIDLGVKVAGAHDKATGAVSGHRSGRLTRRRQSS